jgi:hypothetical protein
VGAVLARIPLHGKLPRDEKCISMFNNLLMLTLQFALNKAKKVVALSTGQNSKVDEKATSTFLGGKYRHFFSSAAQWDIIGPKCCISVF